MLFVTETNRKWWVLAAAASALAMIFIDGTAISVALPAMQEEFKSSDVMLQWVMNAYLLAIASGVIFGGRLGDIISYRTTFMWGVSVFVVGSILCGLAQNDWFEIFSRTLQGIGGAIMTPAIAVIMFNAFQEHERGKAMGFFVGISSVFGSIGPFIGGLLTDALSWRWVFWMNVPISILCLILSKCAIPHISSKQTVKHLDWIGFILQAIALMSLILLLIEGVNWGWTSPFIIGLLIVSLLSSILFYKNEKKVTHPLVDFDIFKIPHFRHACLILLALQASFACFVYWIIYFQEVLHYTPTLSGLFILPVTVPITLFAPISGRLYDKYGPRLSVSIGVFFLGVSILWNATFLWSEHYYWLLPGLILFGCSSTLAVSPSISTAMASVDITKRGMASGIVNAARQLGAVFGIALVGSIINNFKKYQLTQNMREHLPIESIDAIPLKILISHTESSIRYLSQLAGLTFDKMQALIAHAFTTGFSCALFLLAIGILSTYFLAKRLPSKIKPK